MIEAGHVTMNKKRARGELSARDASLSIVGVSKSRSDDPILGKSVTAPGNL